MKSLIASISILAILSAFIYLALVLPIESFRPSLATVPFKRRLYAVSLGLAVVLLLLASRVLAPA